MVFSSVFDLSVIRRRGAGKTRGRAPVSPLSRSMQMAEPKLVLPTMDAIRSWHGVSVPNPAARHALADFEGLIAALEELRGDLVFEDEPAGFEAALQACKDQEA